MGGKLTLRVLYYNVGELSEGGYVLMYDILLTIMLILSVFIIIVIAMQPTKTQSASNAFMGGASQLFGKQKARGFEAVLIKTTVVSLILFFGLAFTLSQLF
ncbi:preprotein translocase subunit SecG [Alkalibacterium subtropicum]|uniref:Protein-export membrane protein SecG n=2 Tax=Alkalibacterium TaxID=99906 RepID=A0A1I1IEU8_9LACT|nr:preprotein translocase subunit SecG [Alkalibacterium subtropicum]